MSQILIIDDDESIRNILVKFLEREGYNTISVENGNKALEILKYTSDINLIILDIMMPEMDGIEVLKKISKDKKLSQIPILMLTAKDTPLDRFSSFMEGASDYLTKPFEKEVLLEKIRDLISY